MVSPSILWTIDKTSNIIAFEDEQYQASTIWDNWLGPFWFSQTVIGMDLLLSMLYFSFQGLRSLLFFNIKMIKMMLNFLDLYILLCMLQPLSFLLWV